ncbi:MAG TPA: metalloregulator ArsR/SmtB family transcription factor [Candidatus Limnocylindria bacterium]|nr:metalloregulator ArsR/SmtB family transcription factor [Candidatus Limnocylindria bacterium]
MQNGVPERPIDPAAVAAAEQNMLSARDERRMRQLLEALCDPTRVKIVQALTDTTLAAGDLAHVIGRSRSATSQHLKVLRDLGAVVASRNGNVVRYSVATGLTGTVVANAVAAFQDLRNSTSGD